MRQARVEDFPSLLDRFKKKWVRFLQKKDNWMQVEAILQYDKQMIAFFAEDQFFHGQKEVSFSVVKRNKVLDLIQKIELKEQYSDQFEEVENILLSRDAFLPAEEIAEPKGNYITLEDFKISQEDVRWVKDEAELRALAEEIKKEQPEIIAFDGENGPNFIPFSEEWTAILQIAFARKIYILDLLELSKKKENFQVLQGIFENFDSIKLGVDFKNDLKSLLKTFDASEVILRNYVELSDVSRHITGYSG